MHLRNTRSRYGLLAILLHWTMAVLLIGLYLLGDYMVDLGYYDPWFLQAPEWHRDLGMLAGVMLVLRWGWRLTNPLPTLPGTAREQRAALWVHRLFYALIAVVVLSGYLILSADGQPVSIFGLVALPPLLAGIENQEDVAGLWHARLALLLMLLVLLHVLAALKHHFIDGDDSLLRMLGLRGQTTHPEDPK